MIYEYLKSIIEKMYMEGSITKEEREKLIQAISKYREKGGDAMKR